MSARQIELCVPAGLCDYWRWATDVSCGTLHKAPEFAGWSGPLCAKCCELRSWLKQYLFEAAE